MKKFLVALFWALLCATSFAQTYNQATFGIDYGASPNQIGINFPAGWKPFMKVDPATGVPTINASWITEGTFSMSRFPSPANFPGLVSATQPASTDDSTTLVSSSWIRQFFPGLTTSVSGYGQPGVFMEDCASTAECGLVVRQYQKNSSESLYPPLTVRQDQTYAGGGLDGRTSTLTSFTNTSKDSQVSSKGTFSVMNNRSTYDTSGWPQNVATASYSYQEFTNGSATGSISGTTLTVTRLRGGELVNGLVLSGGTIAPTTVIVSQLTSTEPGGALRGLGTYQVNISQTVASTNFSASWPQADFTGSITGTTMTVTAIGNGVLIPTGKLKSYDPNLLANTSIVSQLTGTAGGTGTYQVNNSHGTPLASGKIYMESANDYEVTRTWGAWNVCEGLTRKDTPRANCVGSENDVKVLDGNGLDPDKRRIGMLVGAGSSAPDLNTHIGSAMQVNASNATIDHGLYFYDCLICSSASQGVYDTFIADSNGRLQLKGNGQAVHNATIDNIMTLSRDGSGGAELRIEKTSGAFETSILGRRGNVSRWKMVLGDATAEGGANSGSNFFLQARDDAGAAGTTAITCLRSNGFCGFVGATPLYPVTVTGIVSASDGVRLAPKTVATLATCNATNEGLQSYVTDSNAALAAGLGNIVVGGGANKVLVGCDGTNWRIGL